MIFLRDTEKQREWEREREREYANADKLYIVIRELTSSFIISFFLN